MFTKVCFVLVAALLATLLVANRPSEVAHAQRRIEYKFVRTEVFLTADGKEATSGGENIRFYRTQDALNEYAKNGWELVTASYVMDVMGGNSAPRAVGQLIFMKK